MQSSRWSTSELQSNEIIQIHAISTLHQVRVLQVTSNWIRLWEKKSCPCLSQTIFILTLSCCSQVHSGRHELLLQPTVLSAQNSILAVSELSAAARRSRVHFHVPLRTRLLLGIRGVHAVDGILNVQQNSTRSPQII